MRPQAERPAFLPASPALVALAGLSALSWIYLARPLPVAMDAAAGAMAMPGGAMSMPMSSAADPWTSAHLVDVLAMWSAMVIAMMLPVAAPTLIGLTRSGTRSACRILAFAGGYLAPWLGLAVAVTLLQLWLERLGILAAGVVTDLPLGSLIVVAIGIFQVLPLKRVCLARCAAAGRAAEASDGWNAALSGVRYAAPCLGASGALMIVPAASGLMTAPWLALLTVWLLLERLAPRGGVVAVLGGLGLIAYAAAQLWVR